MDDNFRRADSLSSSNGYQIFGLSFRVTQNSRDRFVFAARNASRLAMALKSLHRLHSMKAS